MVKILSAPQSPRSQVHAGPGTDRFRTELRTTHRDSRWDMSWNGYVGVGVGRPRGGTWGTQLRPPLAGRLSAGDGSEQHEHERGPALTLAAWNTRERRGGRRPSRPSGHAPVLVTAPAPDRGAGRGATVRPEHAPLSPVCAAPVHVRTSAYPLDAGILSVYCMVRYGAFAATRRLPAGRRRRPARGDPRPERATESPPGALARAGACRHRPVTAGCLTGRLLIGMRRATRVRARWNYGVTCRHMPAAA